MPLFEKFFNKKQAPEDGNSGGGGSVSPEKKNDQYVNLEVKQTWVAKDVDLRIHIDSIDPVSVTKFGIERGLHLYDSIEALQKELADGQFILNVKKKKNSSDTQNNGEGASKSVPNTEGEASGPTVPRTDVAAPVVPAAAAEASTTEPGVPVNTNVPDASVSASASTSDKGPGTPEAGPDILEQLKEERVALKKMMDGYEYDLENRIQTGWITFREATRIGRTLEESDMLIRESLAKIKEKNFPLDQAREELKIMRVNLPIVRMWDEYEEGIKFFTAQERGSEEAENIEKMLQEAKAQYIESLPGKRIGPKSTVYWRENILPHLEDQVLEYMDTIVLDENEGRKKRLNRGALREIFLKIVDAEINSK